MTYTGFVDNVDVASNYTGIRGGNAAVHPSLSVFCDFEREEADAVHEAFLAPRGVDPLPKARPFEGPGEVNPGLAPGLERGDPNPRRRSGAAVPC